MNLLRIFRTRSLNEFAIRGVQTFLKGYDTNIKILDYTVGDLIGVCEETVENCYAKARYLADEMEQRYRPYPVLASYAGLCRDVKLNNYCLLNFNKVQASILDSISPGQRQVLRAFLNHLPEENYRHLNSLKEAYNKMKSKLGVESGESYDEAKFISELDETMSKFILMNRFWSTSLTKPAPSSNDILVTEWDKLCSVAGVFYDLVESVKKGL